MIKRILVKSSPLLNSHINNQKSGLEVFFGLGCVLPTCYLPICDLPTMWFTYMWFTYHVIYLHVIYLTCDLPICVLPNSKLPMYWKNLTMNFRYLFDIFYLQHFPYDYVVNFKNSKRKNGEVGSRKRHQIVIIVN